MLKPNKYTNVNLSVLAISAELLKLFKKSQEYTYPELINKIIHKKGEGAKSVFLPALNFLFLLGKIEYLQDGDRIRYINEN